MHLNTITAAGLAVATTANALLLPPEISASDSDIINALPIEVHQVSQASTLKLDCPGCPVPVRSNKVHDGVASFDVKTDIPSHLELDFSINSESGVDRLMLNGFELYPNSDPFHQTLSAPLIPDVEGKRMKRPYKLPVPTQQLGFGLQVQKLAKSQDDMLELLQLELQIIEVGNVFIDGIRNVEIRMVKTPDEKLWIAEVAPASSQTILKTPMEKQEECTTLLCKWRAMIMSQLARIRVQKHCPGRKGHATQGHIQVDADGTHHLPGHRRPHGFGKGHHAHHGHHAHKHSWGQLFKNITSHILLPVAIGIVAGVSVSILGMMVGTFIICLWRTFFRPAGRRHHHRRRAGSHHKASQRDAAADDEKSGLIAHQDEEAPPAYVEEGVVSVKQPEDEA